MKTKDTRHKRGKRHRKQDKPAPEGKEEGGEAAPETPPAGETGQAGDGAAAGKRREASPADQLLRLRADFENYRKRTLREKNEIYRRANEDVMMELLSVLDHMELALKAAEDHGMEGAVTDGFRLVAEQLHSVLGRFGLAPVDSEGQEFDPQKHEAVAHMPSDEVPENIVIAQVRRGYMLGGMLLRAAQSVVSSGPAGTGEEQAKGEDTQEEGS